MMATRNIVLLLLCVTVVAPIVLYTDRLGTFKYTSAEQELLEDVSAFVVSATDSGHLNLPQETSTVLKEPIGVVYTDDSTNKKKLSRDTHLVESREYVSARVLSATNEDSRTKGEKETPIKLVTDGIKEGNQSKYLQKADATGDNIIGEDAIDVDDNDGKLTILSHASDLASETVAAKQEKRPNESRKANKKGHVLSESNKQNDQTPSDARLRKLKDQLLQARVFLSLPAIKNNPPITRELRLRVKEATRTIGDASKDSDLPKNANERMKTIEQSLMKGRQIQDDCAGAVKKLRAMLHSTEDQLRVHKKQTLFLTQLTAKTMPKGLHCLPLRLTTEYYNFNSSQQQFPNQEKLEDPQLYHYAIFSDNILAAAVVVNSTVAHAKVL